MKRTREKDFDVTEGRATANAGGRLRIAIKRRASKSIATTTAGESSNVAVREEAIRRAYGISFTYVNPRNNDYSTQRSKCQSARSLNSGPKV